jgi:hypothetical protein
MVRHDEVLQLARAEKFSPLAPVGTVFNRWYGAGERSPVAKRVTSSLWSLARALEDVTSNNAMRQRTASGRRPRRVGLSEKGESAFAPSPSEVKDD